MNYKKPKPTPLEKRVEAIHKRVSDVENIAHADLFKEAATLVYDSTVELKKTLAELKRLKTPWWKRFVWRKKTTIK